jgi:hypothetical protein
MQQSASKSSQIKQPERASPDFAVFGLQLWFWRRTEGRPDPREDEVA